jgi:endonuclease-3
LARKPKCNECTITAICRYYEKNQDKIAFEEGVNKKTSAQ